jgi:hypothetical protein
MNASLVDVAPEIMLMLALWAWRTSARSSGPAWLLMKADRGRSVGSV